MNAYEKIIKTMRAEGNKNPAPVLQLATMTSERSCKLGTMELDADDLLFCVYAEAGDRVVIYRISNDKYVVLGRVVY